MPSCLTFVYEPRFTLATEPEEETEGAFGFFVKQENGDAGSTNGTKDGQNRKFLLLPWPPLLPSCFSHLGGSVNQNDGSEDRKTKPITKLVPTLVLSEEV